MVDPSMLETQLPFFDDGALAEPLLQKIGSKTLLELLGALFKPEL